MDINEEFGFRPDEVASRTPAFDEMLTTTVTLRRSGEFRSLNAVEIFESAALLFDSSRYWYRRLLVLSQSLDDVSLRLGAFPTTTPGITAHEAVVYHALSTWHVIRAACRLPEWSPKPYVGLTSQEIYAHLDHVFASLAESKALDLVAIRQRLRLEAAVLREIANRSPEQGPGFQQISNQALALALLLDHPEWTDTRIAEAIGITRQTLYKPKYEQYQRFKELLRGEVRRGEKTASGEILAPVYDD